jgi:hypothetical protein
MKDKPDRFYCGDGEEHEHTAPRASMSGRTFRYQMVYGNYPAYAFAGMNNAQTVAVIRAAMAELSRVSGAKFVESSKSPNVRFYFTKVPYNAIGAYMGKGKIYLSQTRKITAAIAKICVQHEVGHYLGIKASPASDKWGHCPTKSCVMNINGTGPVWCERCKSQLVRRYGRA